MISAVYRVFAAKNPQKTQDLVEQFLKINRLCSVRQIARTTAYGIRWHLWRKKRNSSQLPKTGDADPAKFTRKWYFLSAFVDVILHSQCKAMH